MMEALDLFSSLLNPSQTTEWSPFQKQAWARLQQMGFPQKKEEAFQYVSLRKLYDGVIFQEDSSKEFSTLDISSLLFPESRDAYLVFQDGIFRPELSKIPSSLVAFSLEQALTSSYGSFLKHRMHLLIEQEKDPWALLNGALSKSGAFIYVPPKTQIQSPIQVLHIQTDAAQPYVGPRMHLFLGAHAEIQMVSSFHSPKGCKTLCNDFLDVSLEEKASFRHMFSNENQSFSWGLSSFRASLKKESRLHSCAVFLGSPGFRRDYFVSLLGERAEADLTGLTALGGNTESHVHVHMEHSAPLCRSNQFFKNVLASHSRSSFTGKIYVKRIAQKTQAYQLNQNLLLSDHAVANTKPNLEIFADDVKASHGATIAQLDEEQVLYLRTRGIPLQEAQSLLTIGFCGQVLDAIEIPSLRIKLAELCRHLLLNQG